MMSASLSTLATIQIARSRTSSVNAQTNNTGPSPAVSGRDASPDNLVHPLAAEVVLISNLGQRLAIVAHLCNFAVALVLVLGTWLEWAPAPTDDLIQGRLLGLVQLVCLVALTHVANPCSQMD